MAEALLKMGVVLESLECCACGITFAFPRTLMGEFRNNHADFHCPRGHSQHFPGKSKEERLREQLEAQLRRATQEAHRAVVAERERDAAKRNAARLMKRATAGLCPCCNRTFSNLARHMATKHKDAKA